MTNRFAEPGPLNTIRDQAIARNLERVAWLMDRALAIPGTRISVGLDALLGLLPVGGDVLTGLVQATLVLVALRQYKVPNTVAARMMTNVLLDTAIGCIPILGDIFDIGFKANTRNIKLLEPYGHRVDIATSGQTAIPIPIQVDSMRRRTPWRLILPIAAVLFIVLALVLIGFITVVRWLFHF
jgi:nitrate reductase NapE component